MYHRLYPCVPASLWVVSDVPIPVSHAGANYDLGNYGIVNEVGQ